MAFPTRLYLIKFDSISHKYLTVHSTDSKITKNFNQRLII